MNSIMIMTADTNDHADSSEIDFISYFDKVFSWINWDDLIRILIENIYVISVYWPFSILTISQLIKQIK